MDSARGQNIREQRVVVVGGGGVGKSTLTVQFVAKQFNEGYDPTIEDSYRKRITVNDEPVTLEILDTAGQEEYGAMREQWYRHGDGFILVFSITSRDSFDEVTAMYHAILRTKDRDYVPLVMVANKCDLEAQREVGVAEARALAKQLGCPFIEASAKEGVNVNVAFESLVKLIRKDHKRIAHSSTMLEKARTFTTESKDQTKARDKPRLCTGCVIS